MPAPLGDENRRSGFFRRTGGVSGLMGDDEQENGIFQEDRRLVGAGGDDEQENGISKEDRRLVGADGGRRTGERDFSGGQHTVTVLRHVHSYFV